MTIAFVGGGTLGPVTPLLAVYAQLRAHQSDVDTAWVWFGTEQGPERAILERYPMEYVSIPVAKWGRFSSSWKNVLFPLQYGKALYAAYRALTRLKPDVIVNAGGFTAVPVIRVASHLGIPCVTHQLDYLPSLTNRFVADRCVRVTTSFSYTKPPFGASVKTECIPTPTRVSLERLPARAQALRELGFSIEHPTILVFGGGTGAMALNGILERSWKKWVARGWQVIHLTGVGKQGRHIEHPQVVQREFCAPEDMPRLYAAADVVVSRAGMGTLSEASALRKPLVLLPIVHPHQAQNARAVAAAEAGLVLDETSPDIDILVEKAILKYLHDPAFSRLSVDRLARLVPTDQGEALAGVVEGVLATTKEEEGEHEYSTRR